MHNIYSGNKTRKTIQRFLIYGFFGVIVFVLTALLIFALKGYDLDRDTGEVIQNGLILVDAYPVEAKVYLNGQIEPGETPKRLAVPAGIHNVRLEAPGYRTWTLDTKVTEGNVTWLYYPNLIPNVIEKNSFQEYSQKPQIFQSLNKKHLLIYETKDKSISFYESNQERLLKSFDLPTEEKKISKFTVYDWLSHDRLVAGYNVDKRTKVIVIDINQGITPIATFRSVAEVQFNEDQLIIRNEENLFSTNYLEDEIVLVNIDNNSKDFQVFKNDIYSLTSDNRVINLDNEEKYFESNKTISSFAISTYDDGEFLAAERENQIALYKNLTSDMQDVPTKIISLNNIQEYDFSNTGRFLRVSSTDKSFTYNLERATSFKLDHGTSSNLNWIDDVRYSFIEDNQLFIVDFNGFNEYLIGESLLNGFIGLSPNDEKLYNLFKSDISNNFILQVSNMTAAN